MKVSRNDSQLITNLALFIEAGAGVSTARPAASQPAAQPELTRAEHSASSMRPAADLDVLWSQGRYAELVDRVAQNLRQIETVNLEQASPEWLTETTAQLYLMQHRLIGASNQLSLSEQPKAARSALEALKKVGDLQTALFERAVALADEKDKSPVHPWVVFKNTMKKPGFHKPTAAERYFVEKLQKFVRAGGDIRDIQRVTPEALRAVASGAPYEWVVDAYDVARIGPAFGKVTPGHTLLAWGQDVLAAGSVRFFKDEAGKIQQAVIGTFSGHYRSNRDYVTHFARHLAAAGVPPERIFSHAGEAASPRALEILYRAIGGDGADLQKQIDALEREAARFNPSVIFVPPEEKRKDIVVVGERPKTDAMRLRDAVFAMEQVTQVALRDGAILRANGEARGVVRAIEDVLILSEQAGDPGAYNQAMGLLRHLVSRGALNADAASLEMLNGVYEKWSKHTFGSGAFDAADVFGPRPSADRRTRIVATIDPKADEAALREMIDAGISVARLNPAHGSIAELKAAIARVRKVAREANKTVLVQIDLPGPKIRLGRFKNPKNLEHNDIWLKEGETVTLTTADVLGDEKLLPVDFPTLAKDVKVGHRIFLNDGNVELEVVAAKEESDGTGTVTAKVKQGGKVWDRKGINLPDSTLSTGAVTAEDVAIIDALLSEIDLLAVSFVSSVEDVLTARNEMAQRGRIVPVIAKIERRAALDNLRAIAAVSDGLMVARGDLGVEIPYEEVPGATRRINEIGNILGKPTMVATEVLMSMVDNPSRPSRGDAEGVYGAIEQGAEAIMLGKETSYSQHPGRIVEAAARLARRAEADRIEGAYERAVLTDLTSGTVLDVLNAAQQARSGSRAGSR